MDLTALKGRACPPGQYEVAAIKIAEYAEAVGDPNPLYRDPAYARETPYGGIVAPPTFAAAFASRPMRLLLADPAFQSETGLSLGKIIHGAQEYQFHAPIRPGDRLTTTGVITDVYQKKEMTFIIIDTESRDAGGTLKVSARITVIVR